MELKTLLLGLVMSTAAFAIKTGLGWGYVLAGAGWVRRVLFSLGLVAGYGAFFRLVYAAVVHLNVLQNYERLLPLLQNGMLLHWIMAALLMVWAVYLLRRENAGDACCPASKGWLAMVVPCPVCLGVVLLAESGLALYFPEEAGRAVFHMYLAFMAAAGLSAALWLAGNRIGGGGRNEMLGLAMLFIAGYFLLFALVAPQFSDMERIYRLASYSRGEDVSGGTAALATVAGIVLLLGIGFVMGYWKNRRIP